MRIGLLVVAAAVLATGPALAAGPHVATLVVVKTPPGLSRAALEDGFQKAVPTYQKIPGLIRKYFTATDTSFGGIYLWTDRAAAEAWYTPAWAAQCKARYGSDCQLSYFDSPLQIDGAAKGE